VSEETLRYMLVQLYCQRVTASSVADSILVEFRKLQIEIAGLKAYREGAIWGTDA
jgi:hypothetical protein